MNFGVILVKGYARIEADNAQNLFSNQTFFRNRRKIGIQPGAFNISKKRNAQNTKVTQRCVLRVKFLDSKFGLTYALTFALFAGYRLEIDVTMSFRDIGTHFKATKSVSICGIRLCAYIYDVHTEARDKPRICLNVFSYPLLIYSSSLSNRFQN